MTDRIRKIILWGLTIPLTGFPFGGPSLRGQTPQGVLFDRVMPATPDGRSYPVIHDLIQDRRGFIWIAGPHGLARYDGNSFLFFQHREGDSGSLSDDLLFNVFEDSRGDIWATSEKGLNLLDRKTGRFIHFRHDPSDPGTLSSDRIRAICEDAAGALWIGTKDGGVNRMDPETRLFTRFLHDPADPHTPGSNAIWTLLSARDGKIWMGATDAGLDCVDPRSGSWSHYPHQEEIAGGLVDRHYWALRETRDGRIWIGSNKKGLFRLDPATGKFQRIHLREKEALWWDYRILALHEDRNGILWIGTEDAGLYRLDPGADAPGRASVFADRAGGLSHNTVMSIWEDREGLLWFGTANGISILDEKRRRFPVARLDPAGKRTLAEGEVLSLFEDGREILWIGTAKGGLQAWERRSGSWTNVRLDPDFENQMTKVRVQAIAEDDRGDLWFGTTAGLFRYVRRSGAFNRYLNPVLDPSVLPLRSITALRGGRPGFLWAGSSEDGFFEWDIDAEKVRLIPEIRRARPSLTRINAIFVDRRGQVWVGTQWEGLIRFDPGTRNASDFFHRPGDARSLAAAAVFSVAEDGRGGIWAGTPAGPCRFDPEREEWTPPAGILRMPDRPVSAIVADAGGNLWMSSGEDLIKIHGESRLQRLYRPEDGLQGGTFAPGAGIRCRNGDIVFGGASGIDCFRPDDIVDSPYLPPVAVASIGLSSPPETIPFLEPPEEYVVSRSRFPVTISVSALGFSRRERQSFRVRMTRPEDRTFDMGNRRELRMDRLKRGPARFVFYAANADEVWNPSGAALTIRVTIPFGQSWIWRLVLAFLGAAFAGLWIRRRRRIDKRQLLHQMEGDLGFIAERFDLTKREMEVLVLILQGKSNRDIERLLFISNKTVRNHIYHLYQKMAVKSRLGLVNAVRKITPG